MEEERPNLRPRLNKALREIERLKKQLEEAKHLLRTSGWNAELVEYKLLQVATADLKPEQDS